MDFSYLKFIFKIILINIYTFLAINDYIPKNISILLKFF